MDELIPWLHAQLDAEEADCRYNEDMSVDVGWNPRRVLEVVTAHRAILAIHAAGADPCDADDASLRTIPCDTVLTIAQLYDHKPGYQERWRLP